NEIPPIITLEGFVAAKVSEADPKPVLEALDNWSAAEEAPISDPGAVISHTAVCIGWPMRQNDKNIRNVVKQKVFINSPCVIKVPSF
ncbi:hypothetical protein NL298_26790, partial [Klebsiella pneumoniae]|nr:hypothetical protein [Klebsiella pneumoniae]